MPKTPAELRGLGVPKDQLNPTTNQLSRLSKRFDTRALRNLGRSIAGKAVGGLATGALVLEGYYDWGVIINAGINAITACGCD